MFDLLKNKISSFTNRLTKKVAEEKPKEVKLTTSTKIKKIITGKIKLNESDLTNFLDDFEIELLEADVSPDTADEIIAKIKERLVGKEIGNKEDINKHIKDEIKDVLNDIMETDPLNFEEEINKEKPFVILFLSKKAILGFGVVFLIIWSTNSTFKDGRAYFAQICPIAFSVRNTNFVNLFA